MRQDFEAYWRSISDELTATKDRVRHLIADTHWQTEGESKEVIFRKVLRGHISETLRVGRGFVCFPYEDGGRHTSTQLDVLVTDMSSPTLFKEGDLTIVTPDAVRAVVEVKTIEDPASLKTALEKLSDDVARIRQKSGGMPCWAGLFVFEGAASKPRYRNVLEILSDVTRGDQQRVINCVAWGPSLFTRYWQSPGLVASPLTGPGWHSYDLTNLAPGYFLSNLVWGANPAAPDTIQQMWYPIEGTKESKRKHYVGIAGDVHSF